MPGFEDYGIQFDKLVDPNYIPHFLELSEHSPDELSIFLDQHAVRPKNLSLDQQHWREHGYVIKREASYPTA